MKIAKHWTISRLKSFETCPAQYQYQHLFEASDWKKLGYLVVPGQVTLSPAMLRGTEIHEDIERYLQGRHDRLTHPEISPAWALQIEALNDVGASSEEMWSLDDGWHPTTRNVWLRMKIDAYYQDGSRMVVIDFKTGKPWKTNSEQLEVYALGTFAMFDDIKTVDSALWYLDSEEPHEKTFNRSQASKLARKWEARAGAMLAAKRFPARASFACKWCPFNKTNGGPCPAVSDN